MRSNVLAICLCTYSSRFSDTCDVVAASVWLPHLFVKKKTKKTKQKTSCDAASAVITAGGARSHRPQHLHNSAKQASAHRRQEQHK